MAQHTHVEPNPKQLEDAQKLWANFTVVSKYSIIVVAIILVIMAAAFTDLL